MSSARYDGARLRRILKVRSRILKSMQDLIGSQCSCCRAGVMCSAEGVLVMIHTAAFWTSWSLWSDFRGRPWRRELQYSQRDVSRVFTRIAVQAGVSEGWRWFMLRRWKYADWVTLLMWASNFKVLSRVTPRLLTWGDCRTVELLMDMEKGLCFARVDLVPTRRTSVLSLFS